VPPPPPLPFIVGETYVDRLGEFKVVAIEGKQVVIEYADGQRTASNIEQKALIYRNILLERDRSTHLKISIGAKTRRGPERYFSHEEVFPLIAAIIESEFIKTLKYVDHDVIVDRFTHHRQAEPILARCPLDHSRKPSWWPHCMVAWFSKIFTDGRSDWNSRFERKKIRGKWAYRVRR
jgi:hypothetical protein